MLPFLICYYHARQLGCLVCITALFRTVIILYSIDFIQQFSPWLQACSNKFFSYQLLSSTSHQTILTILTLTRERKFTPTKIRYAKSNYRYYIYSDLHALTPFAFNPRNSLWSRNVALNRYSVPIQVPVTLFGHTAKFQLAGPRRTSGFAVDVNKTYCICTYKRFQVLSQSTGFRCADNGHNASVLGRRAYRSKINGTCQVRECLIKERDKLDRRMCLHH